MSDFIERIADSAKSTVERLKNSPIEHQEVMVEMSSMLARTHALQVLDVWLDIVGQHIYESPNVEAFFKELSRMRFEEMEDKKICGIENVFGEQNKLLYSGQDFAKAVAVLREQKEKHPNIRIEHWVNGQYKYTYVLNDKNQFVGAVEQ